MSAPKPLNGREIAELLYAPPASPVYDVEKREWRQGIRVDSVGVVCANRYTFGWDRFFRERPAR